MQLVAIMAAALGIVGYKSMNNAISESETTIERSINDNAVTSVHIDDKGVAHLADKGTGREMSTRAVSQVKRCDILSHIILF